MATILETERLVLRQLGTGDAPFILELLNTPTFKEFIGDRNIRTNEDAGNYIINGPMRSYLENGFGLWLLLSKESGSPLGMCGLIRREGLEDADIGFAIMPEFEGKGFAFEIASAVMDYGRKKLGMKRIVAITTENNLRSIKLLKKIGLKFEKLMYLPGDTEELMLFGNGISRP